MKEKNFDALSVTGRRLRSYFPSSVSHQAEASSPLFQERRPAQVVPLELVMSVEDKKPKCFKGGVI